MVFCIHQIIPILRWNKEQDPFLSNGVPVCSFSLKKKRKRMSCWSLFNAFGRAAINFSMINLIRPTLNVWLPVSVRMQTRGKCSPILFCMNEYIILSRPKSCSCLIFLDYWWSVRSWSSIEHRQAHSPYSLNNLDFTVNFLLWPWF